MNRLQCSTLIAVLAALSYLAHGRSVPETSISVDCQYDVKKTPCDACFGVQSLTFTLRHAHKADASCPKSFDGYETCVGCVYKRSYAYSPCSEEGYKYRYDVLQNNCPSYCPAKRLNMSNKKKCSAKMTSTVGLKVKGNYGIINCKYEAYELIGKCNPKTSKQQAKFRKVAGSHETCKKMIERMVNCEGCTYSPSNMYDACCREGTKCKLDVLDNWCSSECPKYRCRPENLVACVYVPSADEH